MMQNMLSIAAIVIAAGYGVFSFLDKERSVSAYAFSAALLSTSALEAFDLLALAFPEDLFFWKRTALIAEALLPPTWLLFSLSFSRKDGAGTFSIPQRVLLCASPLFLAAALLIPPREFFSSPDFTDERMLFLGNQGFAFYIGVLAYMTVALVNLENTFLASPRIARWKIKFDILGAGALIAMMVFYYSQGLLYRSINMNLLPVRSSILIISVALIVYSRARRNKDIKVYVSKQIAYRSVVIFIIGLYLIGLGLIGEGMRYFGGSARKVMLTSFVFISAICLLIILLSETVKRKIKVLLHKNFYTNKYDYRVQWLQFTDRLSSSHTGEELLKAVLSGFCETFGMGGASLFLASASGGGDRQAYSCAVALETDPVREVLGKDNGLIRSMRTKKRIVSAHDGDYGATGEDRGFLLRNGMAFLVPLSCNGDVEGFIALCRPINRQEIYTYEDYDLMKTFAQHASSAILNLRLSDELSRAKEMEAAGRISTFVIHDLKNLVSAVSLIVDNAEDYMDDPGFRKDMLRSMRNTADKMRRLIARLGNLEEKQFLNRVAADLSLVVYEAARMIGGEIKVNAGPALAEVDVEEMRKVVLNLILNALEATDGKGPVTVDVGGGGMAFIRVKDGGCGMTDEFRRRRLFKPFSTTKANGLGVGLYQCRQIIEAHGGRIEVSSEIGKGSTFTVYLPAAQGASCPCSEQPRPA